MEKTLKVDPLSEIISSRIARTFYVMGRFESAVAYLSDALELQPDSYQALALRGAAQIELGNHQDALSDFTASLALHHNVESLAMIGVAFAKLARTNDAYKIIRRVENESNNNSQHSVKLAHIYLALNQRGAAYDALERAYLQHESDFRALTYDPRWNSIRNEKRFRELVERVGLPHVL
jgi:tetratricopeptide (TPR) repeat protein